MWEDNKHVIQFMIGFIIWAITVYILMCINKWIGIAIFGISVIGLLYFLWAYAPLVVSHD